MSETVDRAKVEFLAVRCEQFAAHYDPKQTVGHGLVESCGQALRALLAENEDLKGRLTGWESHCSHIVAENEALRARLPRDCERFVRVGYPEMVDRLKAAHSEPVTLRIEERDGGELYLVATRWEQAAREGA